MKKLKIELELTKENLILGNGSLASILAQIGHQAFADSEFAQDYEILSKRGGWIAYWLARHSGVTGWWTDNPEILGIRDNHVRRELAKQSAAGK